jgi:UDP-N-acetylmuramate--alanine ligase
MMLPMPGHHNALNATAAIAVAYELGMSVDSIRSALAQFGGVKRRFTRTGEWDGAIVFDDYGHHPVEIAAVLRAARASTKGQVIAIVQPHRYSRLQALFESFASCFNDADAVIVADVYAAGEKPIEGFDRDHLVAAIKAHGHRRALPLGAPEALPQIVREIAKPGDYIVFLGAGNITQWAYALPEQLAAGNRTAS